MSCDINTITAAEKDVCYLAGTEISQSSARTVTDQDGNPVNLSGVSLVTHVKRKRTDPTSKAIIIFSTATGTLTVSGANNNVLTWSGVHQIDQDIYYYDTLREDIPEYIEKGKFLVTGNVTRP